MMWQYLCFKLVVTVRRLKLALLQRSSRERYFEAVHGHLVALNLVYLWLRGNFSCFDDAVDLSGPAIDT